MFGTPVSLLIGLILILGSVGLFFLDRIKPAYARDTDKIYAVLILVAGVMATTFQDIGIGESFHILLMAGMLTTLMIENVRTREPKLPVPTQPFDNRPPRPRYSEAPPVRRGYRAELDNRIDPRMDVPPRMDGRAPAGFRGEPAGAARMAPAPAEYWSNAPRQPYEEYRGPAGRLQPSPNGNAPNSGSPSGAMGGAMNGPMNGPMNDRYADANGRYGERPPAARPPMGNPNGSAPNEYAQRPDERMPSQGNPAMDRPRGEVQGDRPNDRPANGERTLNVRPFSEAPRLDLPTENA